MERRIFMNQVMEALLNRRSIRAFEEKPIPREEIEQIVEAGAVCSKWNGTPDLEVYGGSES